STIFSGAKPGNNLPYIPQIQWNVTTGLEGGNWSFHLGTTYVDESYADATNLGLEVNTSGLADARFGKSDSYFLVDLSYRYEISNTTTVFASIQNAFDENWLASRIPHGPRPGAPRQSTIGIEWSF
ncbi:MAG: TonB-dependent receptor, partial [Verrucomicrobia bacterium]|nr:TonB-dependent receptor [Verrucomicrobiota bacterium]